MTGVVRVEGLSVDHLARRRPRRAVDDIGFEVAEGESFGLVGASGSGKTTLALALTRVLPPGAQLHARRLEVAGKDILAMDAASLRRYRRDDVGFVPQEPSRALNPTSRIGTQIAEAHRLHGRRGAQVRGAVGDSLAEVGLREGDLARRYPHELSGGQQQRVMVAMALAGRPRLLILDEPTTGLDVVAESELVALLARLRAERGFASILISHDLDLVAAQCARVGVLDGGRLTERASSDLVGTAPASVSVRVPRAETPAVVIASGLSASRGSRRVLSDIDLRLHRGETLGVVGETGSGKTTLGRAIAGLIAHDGDLTVAAPSSPPPIQFVFQNPESSLNPRRSVRRTLGRAIRLLGGALTVDELAQRTGLDPTLLDSLPHQLSGGQKQRVAIARALAGGSPVVICDEPTSALDAGSRSATLDLMIDVQERTGVAYLFISHDLVSVKRIAHRIAVMRDGRIVETAPTNTFFRDPAHPYTRELLQADRARVGDDDPGRLRT